MKNICDCGNKLIPGQNKCSKCLITNSCKGTDRKCWNDIIVTKNFTYIINEDYFYIRNNIKPTYQYFLSPAGIFNYIKLIKQLKEKRYYSLSFLTFLKKNNKIPIKRKE